MSCQSEVILFRSYSPDQQTRAYLTSCCASATKVVSKNWSVEEKPPVEVEMGMVVTELQHGLEMMSIIAVMVNCALIGMSDLADRLFPGWGTAGRIIFIVVLEVIVLFMFVTDHSVTRNEGQCPT